MENDYGMHWRSWSFIRRWAKFSNRYPSPSPPSWLSPATVKFVSWSRVVHDPIDFSKNWYFRNFLLKMSVTSVVARSLPYTCSAVDLDCRKLKEKTLPRAWQKEESDSWREVFYDIMTHPEVVWTFLGSSGPTTPGGPRKRAIATQRFRRDHCTRKMTQGF